GANGGEDTITASGLGLSTAHATVINVDEFAFLAPTADAEIPLKTSRPVTVRWTKEGVAQPGQTIKFASTRGTLSAGTATTNASGEATVTIQSSNAGFGVLSATTSGSEAITTQRNIE